MGHLLQINGRAVAVDDFGEGTPVLCVHGLGGSSNFWRAVVNGLGDGYRLIVPDLPSAARSANDPSLSIESLAGDMLAVLDALGVDKARVMGHSMGTIVCQHLTVMAPERVQDLVLLGPLAQPPEPARGALMDRAGLARREGMTGIADTIADVALSTATKSTLPDIQGFVREMVIRQDPQGYAQSCEALSRAQAADASAITCPCLLITGDEDKVAPPANVEALGSALPSARVLVLDGCGHWTLNEKPTEVIAAIQAFYG
ncbi:MAG: alpha/beta hydrolase [Pseudomonadota bacterium]